MRSMATIERIKDIKPIPDADAIECAAIKGWTVVVKKGEFSIDDLVIFCEVDSWVPHNIAPFLSKGKEPREYEGVLGERLRTVRLRKQLSQGLVLPLSILPDFESSAEEGQDVSEYLGIIKYEAPIPACLAGMVAGNFPSWIPKTDQERIQNLTIDETFHLSGPWVVEEKLEGSSMTAWYDSTATDGEQFGVCSRNLSLKLGQSGNSFVDAYHSDNLKEILLYLADKFTQSRVAIQGELIGNGIQGNIYKLQGQKFYAFNVILEDGSNMPHATRRDSLMDIEQVPAICAIETSITDEPSASGPSLEDWLEMANGESKLHPTRREGIVVKSLSDPQITFKVISNEYLLKQ